jgi:hypothetical protein
MERPIEHDWIEGAAEAIRRNIPQVAGCAGWLSVRLGAVLIRRLPEHWARQLLEGLAERPPLLESKVSASGDASIGYPEFVDRAMDGICFARSESIPLGQPEELDELARRIADVFLSSLRGQIPDALASDLGRILPAELALKMNLPSVAPEYKPAA